MRTGHALIWAVPSCYVVTLLFNYNHITPSSDSEDRAACNNMMGCQAGGGGSKYKKFQMTALGNYVLQVP